MKTEVEEPQHHLVFWCVILEQVSRKAIKRSLWRHLQVRMIDVQWHLKYVNWRLIRLKKGGRKMIGQDQRCHNQLDNVGVCDYRASSLNLLITFISFLSQLTKLSFTNVSYCITLMHGDTNLSIQVKLWLGHKFSHTSNKNEDLPPLSVCLSFLT